MVSRAQDGAGWAAAAVIQGPGVLAVLVSVSEL